MEMLFNPIFYNVPNLMILISLMVIINIVIFLTATNEEMINL